MDAVLFISSTSLPTRLTHFPTPTPTLSLSEFRAVSSEREGQSRLTPAALALGVDLVVIGMVSAEHTSLSLNHLGSLGPSPYWEKREEAGINAKARFWRVLRG